MGSLLSDRLEADYSSWLRYCQVRQLGQRRQRCSTILYRLQLQASWYVPS